MQTHLNLRRFQSQLKIAAEIWSSIENVSQPADRWLNNFFFRNRKKLGSRDRRFLSETIFTLFRNKTLFRLWIENLNFPKEPHVECLFGAYSEGFIEADVFHSVDERLGGRLPSREALSAAELPESAVPASAVQKMAWRYSFPEWLIDRWLRTRPLEQVEDMLKLCHRRAPLVIRVNPVKCSREDLMKRLEKKDFRGEATQRSPWGISFSERFPISREEEFRDGLLEIQDEGSQLLCQMIGEYEPKNVWDVCAGGGGKSLLIAAIMKNRGRVVATDIRPKKLVELKKRAKRAGLHNIFPADLERMDEIRSARGGFDVILVDAPCSGTGTLRRNPDAKWKLSEEAFVTHHTDQLQILEDSSKRLKSGGHLFYATCSVEREENEAVIEEFLKRHTGFKSEGIDIPGGVSGALGSRLFPSEENDGFFMGLVEKL